MEKPNYRPFAPLIPDEMIQRAERLGAALLADGMIGMGIPFEGCMDAQISPVHDSMRIVGTAYTVSTASGDNLPIHLAIYSGKEGYVLIIDGKGHADHPYLGELMTSATKAVGLKGIVLDGLVRDKQALIELGLPVFAKGFMPRGPIKKEPGEINTAISCGGVTVHPGDLIVGDADGVVVVPRDRIEAVIEASEKKLDYEEKRKITIAEYEKKRKQGMDPGELAPQWVKDKSTEFGL
ncbi:regulator of RNase E activity RraA [Ammoniphilus resinae]|uniref:Putative 4-hydroxy-4-methyl-2-oxoglutarate aldolase n=1 Tax=Ammoniphilus resinae TaxID=861532 RepID=A0ABS4GKQ8_9BACL|nr:regulator of RNase E activity RraA [Ammoniphilus resinae]